MLRGSLYSKRRKGRPRLRWLDDVESDLKKMKVKGWKEKMRNREQWRLVVKETKSHPGLQRRGRRVCVVLCVGSGLATGTSSVQGILSTVNYLHISELNLNGNIGQTNRSRQEKCLNVYPVFKIRFQY
jgi:hypothetical protein